MKAKTCIECQKEFVPQKLGQKTCSPKCQRTIDSRKKKDKLEKAKERKEKKKMNQKTGNKGIRDRLDTIFSRYIRLRDDFTCCVCGLKDKEQIDNGHYIPRQCLELRFDEENCNAQCKTCNGRHNLDREPYRQYILSRYGAEKLEEFSERSKKISKIPRYWYEEKVAYYNAKIASMGGWPD